MLARKLEALERRLTKMMAKDADSQKRYEPARALLKQALDAINEGNPNEALQAMSRFNTLMNENKLLHNV